MVPNKSCTACLPYLASFIDIQLLSTLHLPASKHVKHLSILSKILMVAIIWSGMVAHSPTFTLQLFTCVQLQILNIMCKI